MSHAMHSVQTADERAARRAERAPRRTTRRQSTRVNIILAALREPEDDTRSCHCP